MEESEALKILRSLADGIDPYTGEEFSRNSPYQNAKTVRALFMAIQALEGVKEKERKRQDLPPHAGTAWTEEEESRLVKRFEEGISIPELAQEHQRTRGAIEARLVKLGKIEPARPRFSP